MNLPTLELAIEWASERWANQRAVPIRLHTRDEEGIGLGFTNAFSAALDGRANTVVTTTRTATCWHPLLPKHLSPRDCPECQGRGLKDVRSDLFAFPMSRALTNLANSLGGSRQPHPYALVLVLASHGWLPQQAARAMDLPYDRAEALFLIALRKLHNFYAEGPVQTSRSSVGWIEMSASQQNAVIDGETAA